MGLSDHSPSDSLDWIISPTLKDCVFSV